MILGLDTGYHAGGIPALSDIPGINSIPFLNVNARFDDIMMRWLQQTLLTLEQRSLFSCSRTTNRSVNLNVVLASR